MWSAGIGGAHRLSPPQKKQHLFSARREPWPKKLIGSFMGGELALSCWNLATQHSKPGLGNCAVPCTSDSCGIFLQVITGWINDLAPLPSPSYTGQPQSLGYKASLFPACGPLFLVLLLNSARAPTGAERGPTWVCPCLVPRAVQFAGDNHPRLSSARKGSLVCMGRLGDALSRGGAQ